MLSNQDFPKITLGVSSCLMGQEVRFDGGHKRNPYLLNDLSRFLEFKTFCPEVAIGLGIPRPSMRLVQQFDEQGNETTVVLDSKTGEDDYTNRLSEYSQQVVDTQLADISGYVFKKDSPSCGMSRVKVYNAEGHFVHKDGIGIYAERIKKHFPLMPMEEEGRLNDLDLRENFLMRAYLYHDWKALIAKGITAAGLVEFHSQQKYLLMAHHQDRARAIGQLVATAGIGDIESTANEYIDDLMDILKQRVSRKRHTNVLQHIMGYLRKDLDSADKQELLTSIMSYQKNQVPLIMPLTLLRHHFRKYPNPYISKQRYLSPYPVELRFK